MRKQKQAKSAKTSFKYSSRATLCAIGLKLRQMDLLAPIREQVSIKQKKVKYSAFDKLQDALVTILSGAHGLVEVNTRLRSDSALQNAFSRNACAEQSVIQTTLNTCTSKNVAQMMLALDSIFQKHSYTSSHDLKKSLLIVDIDVTALPCGRKAEGSLKGYQGMKGIRYGRQMCRAIAAQYEEVIIDRLYPGNLQLHHVIPPMLEDIERTLKLNEDERKRVVIRMDAGGGSRDDINFVLSRGYQLHGKEMSRHRAEKLSVGVEKWFDDPQHKGRQLGWLPIDTGEYVKAVKRMIICWPKDRTKQMQYACLVSTLEPKEVLSLLNLPIHLTNDEAAVIRAYSKLYDLRGGTVEIEIKESKQGIGINKRSKKRFEAQQIVMLLGSLAHNILIWARHWLMKTDSKFAKYGALRIVRDLFHISGLLEFDITGTLFRITLNKAAPLVSEMAKALNAMLINSNVEIKIGAT